MISATESGPATEAITYPGYTVSNKKRLRVELTDSLDKNLRVGHYALVDVPVDDVNYLLRLCLVRIRAVTESKIDFVWYTYTTYPQDMEPDYKCKWIKQIQAGKGQKVETGWCPLSAVVLTFPALTKNKQLPAAKRTSPYKMVMRALGGGFGPLPQDIATDTQVDLVIHSKGVSDDIDESDNYIDESDEYQPPSDDDGESDDDENEDEDESADVDLTSNLRRSKRLKRNK